MHKSVQLTGVQVILGCGHVSHAGKQRHLRLIPVGALDGHDVDWIKVADTKGCTTFCTTHMDHGGTPTYYFCVAVKKQVLTAFCIWLFDSVLEVFNNRNSAICKEQ